MKTAKEYLDRLLLLAAYDSQLSHIERRRKDLQDELLAMIRQVQLDTRNETIERCAEKASTFIVGDFGSLDDGEEIKQAILALKQKE